MARANVGCNLIHDVQLSDGDAALRDTIQRLDTAATAYLGAASHWGIFIRAIEREAYPETYGDLFSLLHDALSAEEARALLAELLVGAPSKKVLWEILSNATQKKGRPTTPAEISNYLPLEAVYQLMFLVCDEEIVAAVDTLIAREVIKIPAAEVRRAHQGQPTRLGQRSTCSISSLGIRSDTDSPVVSFAIEVWEAHDEADRLTDLSWKTVKGAGPASHGHVLEYLLHKTPEEGVRDLILGNRDVTLHVCESVIMDEAAVDNDPLIIDKMLWKLGFDVPRFGVEHSTLIRHLDAFKAALLECDEPLQQGDREKIRSVGVNLFVELEWFLEQVIGYNTWLLHNDHFSEDFIYNPAKAVAMVADVLPVQEPAAWSRDGGNTLGVLLSYLSACATWMEGLSRCDATETERPDELYPHFADEGE